MDKDTNDYQKFPTVGKIIVERTLEEQIRTMCALSPDKEWSGVLFYTAEGSLEGKSIVIRAKNFYLMDLGSTGYTEFKLGEDPSIARFMVDNDLFDCKSGLIHSHNTMSAFFSGTDTSTLEKEGKSMPNFVSLVVNNAGRYVAAVTHKVTTVFSGKAVSSYNLFGGLESVPEERDFVKSVDTVKIFGLEVEVENADLPLLSRFSELKTEKTSTTSSIWDWKGSSYSGYSSKKEPANVGYGNYPKIYSSYSFPRSVYVDDDDYGSDTLFPEYYSLKTAKEEAVGKAEVPEDFTELIGYCIQELLVANSRFPEREARNIMRNSDYPIISVINTYNIKTNDKAFTTNINNVISALRMKCLSEKTTWEYIKEFVCEQLTNICDDERELSKNKSWYKKPLTVVRKIVNIIEHGDN